ncbi:MAG: Integral membrane protein (intg_mem_TP0381) [Tenericutes bacterium ADurb.Bin239]|nr:MAG: Integral membrane protein (intg_mem_TP0381) [Tenericutes bacterium ADurb.Bin239]
MIYLTDFFGIGGYRRTPEGAWSWQHILFTSIMIAIMIFLGIFLGRKYRNNERLKNRTIMIAAIAIDAFEVLKIIILCVRSGDVIDTILHTLPLFLCSIMLIALPLAAFSKGRLKAAALDFILIFGFIAGIMGTVGAAQNYNTYPVLSFDNVVSAITHCISAFASLFIGITRMASLKSKNMGITCAILLGVVLLAQIANLTIPYNYMFLERDDGTPYSIISNMVNGNRLLYKIMVVGLLVLLIVLFYAFRILADKRKKKRSLVVSY